MTDLSRREWNKTALSSLAAIALPAGLAGKAKTINSKIKGVLTLAAPLVGHTRNI